MLRLYERQLNFVEDILDFHPSFIDVLSLKEKAVFEKYFLPDWDHIKDFREYHGQLLEEDPSIEMQATRIMEKFLRLNHVDHCDLMPPEYYIS